MFANSRCSNVAAPGPLGRDTREALSTLERDDERTEPQAHSMRDRSMVNATNHAVEVYPPDIVRRRSVAWDGMAAEIVQATRPEKVEFRFRAPLHLLAVYDQGIRSDGETFVGGLPRSKLRDVRRKLTFVPAGHVYHDEWQEPSVLTRILYCYFDPARMPTHHETNVVPATFAARLFFEDATLSDTARKFRRLIERAGTHSSPYLEALGIVLAHELIRLNAGAPRIEVPVRGGLASWQQRVITTYIEEHLAEQISLTTLAQLVSLSPYHFCRAFRQSFGTPPHRYHSSHRIERAKTLLVESASSVTEIGLAVGFQETSSFTTAFRKATGQTPMAYRRSHTSIPQGKQKVSRLCNLSAG
jgi:AraC family transcriptional regulator